MQRAAVILAAGKGTRMRSATTKVMHKIAGRMMVDWTLALASDLDCDRQVLVIGTHSEALRELAIDRVGEGGIAIQDPPQGTGHAVQVAQSALSGFSGYVVILYADTPLLPVAAVEGAFKALDDGADMSVLGFHAKVPGGYGRLIAAENGDLEKIVEAKDASPEELAVTFCNSGVMAVKSEHLFSLLGNVSNDNAKGEYYLTDIIEIGRNRGLKAKAVSCDEEDVLGVNSRVQLAEAEAVFQARKRVEVMEAGATLIAPETVFFSFDTKIGQDVRIEPNVYFGTGVEIADNVEIKANSHFEKCSIGTGSTVGPFVRFRGNAQLSDNVQIGNFVEIKNTTLAEGVKAGHLSYLGDGEIGANTNIGAGTIFCNYNGFFKNKTIVGDNSFIGSNSALVAPVEVGSGAFTGSGSVITENVPENALALGRGRQVNIEGWAINYRTEMTAKKQDS